jgi:hypothetical protein
MEVAVTALPGSIDITLLWSLDISAIEVFEHRCTSRFMGEPSTDTMRVTMSLHSWAKTLLTCLTSISDLCGELQIL